MENDSGLSQFLIDRSVADTALGTAFHWYLMIECDNRGAVGKMYAKVAFRYMSKLAEVSIRAALLADVRLRKVQLSERFCGDRESSSRSFLPEPRRSVHQRTLARRRLRNFNITSRIPSMA